VPLPTGINGFNSVPAGRPRSAWQTARPSP
jgi:hypothetical protein